MTHEPLLRDCPYCNAQTVAYCNHAAPTQDAAARVPAPPTEAAVADRVTFYGDVLDEIVAQNVNMVHLEQLDDDLYYCAIYRGTQRLMFHLHGPLTIGDNDLIEAEYEEAAPPTDSNEDGFAAVSGVTGDSGALEDSPLPEYVQVMIEAAAEDRDFMAEYVSLIIGRVRADERAKVIEDVLTNMVGMRYYIASGNWLTRDNKEVLIRRTVVDTITSMLALTSLASAPATEDGQ